VGGFLVQKGTDENVSDTIAKRASLRCVEINPSGAGSAKRSITRLDPPNVGHGFVLKFWDKEPIC
jgi:hypothetical protein